jgi:hypothetical protein
MKGFLIMHFPIRSLVIATAFFVTGISAAQAEVFYYQDPVTKVSVTVPDTWRRTNDQKADDVLTFLAPGNDYAACRVRARADRRTLIYPNRYAGEVQRMNYSRAFWEDYLGEYDDVVLHSVTDNAGLGRGFASYAEASYTTAVGPKVEKRAVVYAALYNDTAYILECSSAVGTFSRWQHHFGSVLKSVDFRKIVHELPTGHYRNFLRDAPIRINGPRLEDVSYY